MRKDNLFLRIRAVAHSIDTLLSYSDNEATTNEDIDILSQIMVALVDEYSKISE